MSQLDRQQEERAVLVTAPSGGSLAQEFVTLTRELLDSGSVAAVLDRVVFAARDIVPGADLVSVTLRSPDGEFHTPVETSQAASDLDQLQYRFGEGACVEAARPSGPFLVCDGLKGLPEVVTNVWPQTVVQTCVVHLIRNTFRLASRRDWDAVKRDIKPTHSPLFCSAAPPTYDASSPERSH